MKRDGHSDLGLTIASFFLVSGSKRAPFVWMVMRLSAGGTDSGSILRHILHFVSQCPVFFRSIRMPSWGSFIYDAQEDRTGAGGYHALKYIQNGPRDGFDWVWLHNARAPHRLFVNAAQKLQETWSSSEDWNNTRPAASPHLWLTSFLSQLESDVAKTAEKLSKLPFK